MADHKKSCKIERKPYGKLYKVILRGREPGEELNLFFRGLPTTAELQEAIRQTDLTTAQNRFLENLYKMWSEESPKLQAPVALYAFYKKANVSIRIHMDKVFWTNTGRNK